jgi:AraC family transcriptional regulator, activator of mtrCDE
MIPLEQLLDGLHVTIGPVAIHALRNDTAVEHGHLDGPSLHYGVRGAGWVEVAERASVGFAARTVIVAPPGRRVRIVAATDARRSDVVVASVAIRATYRGSVGVFDQLHDPLVERVTPNDPVRRSFEDLLDEIDAHRPGFQAMSEALLRRCLIWLLRRCFEGGECRLSWLAPLEDTRLGRALTAMHERPQHCFTLAELAELAGMSRSVFAARFAHAVGQSPIEVLKALRLTRAAELLTCTDLPVKGIAARVGYASRSSFTRAFCARHGLPPADFRMPGRRREARIA